MRDTAFPLRCVLLAAGLWATAAQALPRYKVESIGVLPGDEFSYAIDINNHGEAVGLSRTDFAGKVVTYRQGTLRGLDISFGGPFAVATDVNDRGDVAGSAYRPDGVSITPYIYRDGRADFFAANDQRDGEVYGLNNLGQAVGRLGSAAYLYDGQALRFLQHAEADVQAADINDAGTIAGELIFSGGGGSRRPFTYRDGRYTLLPTLGDFSYVGVIDNAGRAVGFTDLPGGGRATVWDGQGVRLLGTLGGSYSTATNLNARGWILGVSATQVAEAHVFLYADGVMRDLNRLLRPEDAGQWELTYAYGLNDAGQIAGTGIFNGQTRGFVATPVPEPAALALMLAGLGVVGAAARRRAAGPGRA
ncbi:PEP-CTERM sorting domain-containing protein [Azohydromonas caseinilytica]|uniref:PEP-CTERM sorting domain-containing protein n=1 Tax=Azohydromonas caseinilytica TaxID=2728836 RepID=A0A848F9Q9_9BURK|nr:PEP-CTERM sorting domain-containing protein [Azohydromonas caseinilytica]NML16897.1 PEP-CTERM sorting domain-containing protein [Azohydromonas caseinilytica]